MGNLATPLQLATVASALAWPLAAGIVVVLWSKARAAAHARRVAAMEAELQGMYRSIEGQPIPPHLAMVVDALEEGQQLTPTTPASTSKRGAKTSNK